MKGVEGGEEEMPHPNTLPTTHPPPIPALFTLSHQTQLSRTTRGISLLFYWARMMRKTGPTAVRPTGSTTAAHCPTWTFPIALSRRIISQ